MVITDKFVYVHQPKTGGTFVTGVLLQLHDYPWSRFRHVQLSVRTRIEGGKRHGRIVITAGKHDTCRNIPASERDKAIVATIRNPYDHYVSQYEFGWWRRREFATTYRGVPDFERRFPNFPDVSFADFVELMDAAFSAAPVTDGGPRFGWATADFVRYYARRPEDVLARVFTDDAPEAPGEEELFDVRFLHQDRLSDDLHAFLLDVGYPAAEIAFVKDSGRVLPKGRGRSSDQRWESYYTPELRERVRHRNRLLFRVVPEFDV